jgi:Cu/Ag efflux protein CusF
MTRKVKSLDLTLFLLVALVGCAGEGGKPADAARRYVLRGEVVAVDVEGYALRVAHEEIPGYMGAMTMRFPVLDAEVLSGIHEGDRIEATLVVSPDNRYWLEDVKVTARAEPAGDAGEEGR